MPTTNTYLVRVASIGTSGPGTVVVNQSLDGGQTSWVSSLVPNATGSYYQLILSAVDKDNNTIGQLYSVWNDPSGYIYGAFVNFVVKG